MTEPAVADDDIEAFETVIVGAGISGISIAVRLLQSGRSSFVVLEKSDSFGGTWRQNCYPGCRCDVPSHLYCFSFARNPSWDSTFADRAQIHDYLRRTADHFRLPSFVRFHTRVASASWEPRSGTWLVRAVDSSGRRAFFFRSRFLVRATGAFQSPHIPDAPGRESFRGTAFHSSDWPEADGAELTRGKTVAVVGTGASAVQIVPAIAGVAAKVYVCQRTPSWVLPKPQFGVPAAVRRLMGRFPALLWVLWWAIFIMQELLQGMALLGSKPLHALAVYLAERHLRRSISDPALRSALRPEYELGCKRVLLSNDFYESLTRPDVVLLKGAVERLAPEGMVVGEKEWKVDIIVWATGFDVWSSPFNVEGRDGEVLESGTQTFLGITAHGFPNFFMLLGPNTGVGHTSQILMIEAQARYVVSCMEMLRRVGAGTAMEVRRRSQMRFQKLVARRLAGTVWVRGGGCRSWYVNPKTGTVDAIWPSSTIEYLCRTRSASRADYDVF